MAPNKETKWAGFRRAPALKRRQAAEDEKLLLGREVLLVDGGIAAQHEALRDGVQLLGALLPDVAGVGGRRRVARGQDRCRVDPSEERQRAEAVRVDKVAHGKELLEVVLDGRAGDDDAALRRGGVEGGDSFVGAGGLEAMALVAEQQADRWLVEDIRVLAVELVCMRKRGGR